MRLENKVAWISGATKGIGEATARLFAEEGAKVAIIGRAEADGKRIAEEINGAGGAAIFIKCDVTKAAEVENSIAQTIKAFGKLDILVNNAGIVDMKPLHEYSESDWDAVMDVNVKSMFLAFKYAFPYLKQQEKSYVVNVGSISSFVGQDTTPVYTTSKGAVLQLSRSIGLDYAKYGLRCNCVCPGITETPMLKKHMSVDEPYETALKKRLQRVPMGVSLSPRDVAKSILYFSCEDSSGVTATSLIVDCGYLACAEWTYNTAHS